MLYFLKWMRIEYIHINWSEKIFAEKEFAQSKSITNRWRQHSLIWVFNVSKRRILKIHWKSEKTFELIHSEVSKFNVYTPLTVLNEFCFNEFAEGFSHASQASSIDLNAVRLCFQVFLKGPDRQHIPIEPVVSDPIYDKKAMSDLVICKLSKPSSSVVGGEEIILLCEKVNLNL